MSDATARGDFAKFERVTGWGKASSSTAKVEHISTVDRLEGIVLGAQRSTTSVLARGLGRSYGDAAQNAGGTIVDCTKLDRLIEADFDSGVLRVEAGISLDAILRLVVPHGWFLPVTPGTRQATIGGAIAADVHGKNHHRDGAFGVHIEDLALISAQGRISASPTCQPELFWATIGGMGLTGVVAEARLRLRPIETAFMLVDTERAHDIDECMAMLRDGDDRYGYSVAWVDCIARGQQLGRSVLTRGDHARLTDMESPQQSRALNYRTTSPLNVRVEPPFNLIAKAVISVFNELWYRKSPKRRVGELQSISQFFYPLDGVANWNRLYGPRGFTQYQFVVPYGSEDLIRRVIETLQGAGVAPALAVLKRFGEADRAPLSFPMSGWTFALDLSLGQSEIGPILDQIDGLIADAGGRVYLAKDGRLRPELLTVMYPRLGGWQATRQQFDPEEIFVSDLSRRLGLVSG